MSLYQSNLIFSFFIISPISNCIFVDEFNLMATENGFPSKLPILTTNDPCFCILLEKCRKINQMKKRKKRKKQKTNVRQTLHKFHGKLKFWFPQFHLLRRRAFVFQAGRRGGARNSSRRGRGGNNIIGRERRGV